MVSDRLFKILVAYLSNRQDSMLFDYKKNRAWTENLSVVMQIGLTMAGCICFCFFVGLYLDRWLGTRGILTVVFTLLGIAGGGNVVYRQIVKIMENKT
jgi:F0F1-type ATP synthase assembly protein I